MFGSWIDIIVFLIVLCMHYITFKMSDVRFVHPNASCQILSRGISNNLLCYAYDWSLLRGWKCEDVTDFQCVDWLDNIQRAINKHITTASALTVPYRQRHREGGREGGQEGWKEGGREILGERAGDDRTTSRRNLLSDFLHENLDQKPPRHEREDGVRKKREIGKNS